VPRKLLRPFSGTTLIDIALEKLDAMAFFDNRYLAVADPELIETGEKYSNIEILLRDAASVASGVNPPAVSFAHYLAIPTEHIFIFNPCQPLLSIDTIRKAYDYFQETDFDSYTSVFKTRDWIFDHTGNCLTRSDPENYSTNTGEFYHKAAHSFHIVGKTFFKKHGHHWTFTRNDPHLIEMDSVEAVDVDSEMDFHMAESIFKERCY